MEFDGSPHLYSHARARALIGSVRQGVSCLGCSRLRPALQFNYFIRLSHFLAGLVCEYIKSKDIKTKIIGYGHSCRPPLATHLIFKEYSPDILILNDEEILKKIKKDEINISFIDNVEYKDKKLQILLILVNKD